jgi:hypothetical protein
MIGIHELHFYAKKELKNMTSLIPFSIFIILFEIAMVVNVIKGESLVHALFIFGDSIVDVGNNNYLATTVKANLYPYGRDFVNHSPTERFSNGKVASDYACNFLFLQNI